MQCRSRQQAWKSKWAGKKKRGSALLKSSIHALLLVHTQSVAHSAQCSFPMQINNGTSGGDVKWGLIAVIRAWVCRYCSNDGDGGPLFCSFSCKSRVRGAPESHWRCRKALKCANGCQHSTVQSATQLKNFTLEVHFAQPFGTAVQGKVASVLILSVDAHYSLPAIPTRMILFISKYITQTANRAFVLSFTQPLF